MNKKKIIILVIVIAILSALLAMVMMMDSGKDSSVMDADSAAEQTNNDNVYEEKGEVYRCSLDSIVRISVSDGGESFTFSKKDGNWVCDKLSGNSVNSAKISQVATKLSVIKYTEKFDDDVTAEECGITASSPCIVFDSDIGEVTLKFADSFTDENLSYMTSSAVSGVFSVKREIYDSLFESLENYRNDSLRNIDFSQASDIELKLGGEVIVLKKDKADTSKAIFNEWRMTSPVAVIASDDSVNKNIITPMTEIKIDAYVSDNGDFSAYGLSDGADYLKIITPSGKKEILYFANKTDGKYYVRTNDSQSIYAVSEGMMPFASLKAIDLADRHVKLVMKDSLSSVKVQSAQGEYIIKVSQDKGESSVNGKKLTESEFSSNVFGNIFGIVADDIYTGTTGEKAVTVEITYTDSSADVIDYCEYNERYYSVSENGNSGFLILKSKVDTMLGALEKYK